MPSPAPQRVIIALVAAACVAVTALLIVGVIRNRQKQNDPNNTDPFQGGTGGYTQSDGGAAQPRPLREFTLTDQTGKPFNSADLRGKTWIASFFFTRCPTVCPQVLAQTAELQKKLGALPQWKDIRLVSISVDPEHDTPAVLAERAKLWEADPAHWHFLTGKKADIWSLTSARDGFMLGVGDAPTGDAMQIRHSSRFVLVDKQHRVVGYYDALDEAKREELLRDLMNVLK